MSPDCVKSRAGGDLSLRLARFDPEVGPEYIAGARSWPAVGTRFAILGFSHSLSLELTPSVGAYQCLVTSVGIWSRIESPWERGSARGRWAAAGMSGVMSHSVPQASSSALSPRRIPSSSSLPGLPTAPRANRLQGLVSLAAALVLVGACAQSPSSIDESAATLTILPIRRTAVSATIPSSAAPPISAHSTPEAPLQVTYVAMTVAGGYGLYAVTLACPDEAPPCPDEPELLLEMPEPIISGDVVSWSPDGLTLAFGLPGQGGNPDIYISDWSGRNPFNVTESPVFEAYPAWSPDGSRIAYVLSMQGSSLFWSNPQGTDGGQVFSWAPTNEPYSPAWSPDGSLIAYTDVADLRTGIYQVFVGYVAEDRIVQVTHSDRDSYTPEFSPDGSRLVLSRDVMDATVPGGARDQNLFVVSLDGTRETWLAGEPGADCLQPHWSPWAEWIAFNLINSSDISDIYLVRSDGTGVSNLTQTPERNEWSPEWRTVTIP
jgi:hypothetical protein